MNPKPILRCSIAALVILVPVVSRGAANIITGNDPAWATAANWSLGAIPGVNDNAVLQATPTTAGTEAIVDLRGSAFNAAVPPNFTEIQDLTFSGANAMGLGNLSTSANMTLALNGGRGAGVPLIATTTDFNYTIYFGNTAGRTFTLQLKASGDIRVDGLSQLAISSVITEAGGARSLNKVGTGRLILQSANTFTGGVTIGEGVLEAINNSALGTGAVVVNGGTFEANVANANFTVSSITVNPGARMAVRNLTLTNALTLAGGELATRSGDLGNYSGAINITADSSAVLHSYTTPASNLNLTIGGKVSGASALSILGNATNTDRALILTNVANDFSGVFNVTSSQRLRSAPAATGSTLGTAVVNLDGGILQLRDNGTGNGGLLTYNNPITVGAGGGGIDVNRVGGGNEGNTFVFGNLSIGASTLNVTGGNGYGASFPSATLSGDATFNVDSSLTFSGVVGGGAFGITKTGAGTLILNGANTYSGATNLNGGKLVLTGSLAGNLAAGPGATVTGTGSVTGATSAGNGAILDPGNAFGVGTMILSALSFGAVPADTATVIFKTGATPGNLNVTTLNGLTTSGGANSVTLQLGTTLPTAGTHVILDYAGTIGGDGFSAFQLAPITNPRLTASLVHNTTDTRIELNVTSVDSARWTGAESFVWSTNIIPGAKNWRLLLAGTATDYLEGDNVLFDDTATTTSVDLDITDVLPSAVAFNHSTKDYVLSGSQAIAGLTGLIKSGTGTLTISNQNSFTGPVALDGGTVRVAALADSGLNSPLGAGSVLTFDGGTLDFTGLVGASNRAITIHAGGGTIRTDANATVTLAGDVSGTGTLTKAGQGSLALTSATGFSGGLTINSGALQVATVAPSGGPLSISGGAVFEYTGTAVAITDRAVALQTGDATIRTQVELAFTGAFSGPGGMILDGLGLVRLAGTAPNTYAGTTRILSGSIVATKPAGVTAIPGDLIIESGAGFRYTGNSVSNQIADTASVTINGGTFGDPASADPTNPGATDTIANLTINGGSFGSGRNAALGNPAQNLPFTITGLLKVTAGTAVAQRGGGISAGTVEIGLGSINLDGGSTSLGQESRLNVGPGGLTLSGGTVNFNSGPSAVAAGSHGSIVVLGGNVTSTGTSQFVRQNATITAPKAEIDLGGVNRTFDVTGTLLVGTATDHVILVNGGLNKTGTGTLELSGANTYTGPTNVNAGTLLLRGTISGSSVINVASSAILDVVNAPGGFVVADGQTLAGTGTIAGATSVAGTIAPGGVGIGTLHFTDTLTFFAPTGAANFEISKTGLTLAADLADVLTVLTYDGTLIVTATGDALAFGDTFNLFDAAVFSGSFANLSLPALGPDLFWDTADLPVDGTISVVPEPAGTALLLGGLGLLAARRRRGK